MKNLEIFLLLPNQWRAASS